MSYFTRYKIRVKKWTIWKDILSISQIQITVQKKWLWKVFERLKQNERRQKLKRNLDMS